MSRTNRRLPLRRPFAKPRHHNTLIQESKAIDELMDAGYNVPPRLSARISNIMTDWDDLYISAHSEQFNPNTL